MCKQKLGTFSSFGDFMLFFLDQLKNKQREFCSCKPVFLVQRGAEDTSSAVEEDRMMEIHEGGILGLVLCYV